MSVENETRQVDDGDVKVLTTFDEETGEVLDAISSETALEIISMLSDGSMVPKDIAERLGTSIQNVRYHLDKMENAGLVETDGFRYSERGREMSFYRVAESPTVIVFGGRAGGDA
ncbi:MAG: winged helix-turn-helix domain-containing protein [Halobacteriales archaeon]|nr:winged helix-turn-helix domain-containing protein [Halobacteriales archaeon]